MDPDHFAATLKAAATQDPDEKPAITAKELSWAEHVAAVVARQKAAETTNADTQARLNILALPRCEKVTVAGLELEHYNLAHSELLEQLSHPIEVGGKLEKADLATAVLIFSKREVVEGLIDSIGAEKTRALIYSNEAQRELKAALTRDRLEAFTSWLNAEFKLVSKAAGTPEPVEGVEDSTGKQ